MCDERGKIIEKDRVIRDQRYFGGSSTSVKSRIGRNTLLPGMFAYMNKRIMNRAVAARRKIPNRILASKTRDQHFVLKKVF
mmetsp:Transcript_15383/g.21040  ORF Transcript_15383/g.21040 Transcript_15383/m.21040 type:complete len:81 (-) Transcript_15383:96-338(-)